MSEIDKTLFSKINDDVLSNSEYLSSFDPLFKAIEMEETNNSKISSSNESVSESSTVPSINNSDDEDDFIKYIFNPLIKGEESEINRIPGTHFISSTKGNLLGRISQKANSPSSRIIRLESFYLFDDKSKNIRMIRDKNELTTFMKAGFNEDSSFSKKDKEHERLSNENVGSKRSRISSDIPEENLRHDSKRNSTDFNNERESIIENSSMGNSLSKIIAFIERDIRLLVNIINENYTMTQDDYLMVLHGYNYDNILCLPNPAQNYIKSMIKSTLDNFLLRASLEDIKKKISEKKVPEILLYRLSSLKRVLANTRSI